MTKERMRKILGFILFLNIISQSNILAGPAFQVPEVEQIPMVRFWIDHLNNDLVPFWTLSDKSAEVLPFPSFKLDDGTVVDEGNRNLYITAARFRGGDWIIPDIGKNFIRTHARQTFAYGVAYHLTGKKKYFDLMRRGVEWSLENAFDEHGARTIAGAEEPRTSQDQAYSLIGLAFYYYLTRDAQVLQRILHQHQYIMDTYGRLNAQGKFVGLSWLPKDPNVTELVAILDQLNAYMVLLVPYLPEPEASQWKETLRLLCHVMIDQFYVDEILVVGKKRKICSFWGSLDERRLGGRHLDFGHSIKAWWMIHLVGRLLDDEALLRKGRNGMEFLLDQGFVPGEVLLDAARERGVAFFATSLAEEATWGEKFLPREPDEWRIENGVSIGQHWWIHCEMDQAAATCALLDPRHASKLAATARFFVRHFVDHQVGGIWHTIDPITLSPSLMKVHAWKNAYHSFEHALIMSIVSAILRDEPITLHFGFSADTPLPIKVQPYYFTCNVENVQYGTLYGDGRLDMAVTFRPQKGKIPGVKP